MRVDFDHAMAKECGEKSSQESVIQRSATALDLESMGVYSAGVKRGGGSLSDVESGDSISILLW